MKIMIGIGIAVAVAIYVTVWIAILKANRERRRLIARIMARGPMYTVVRTPPGDEPRPDGQEP